MNATREELMQSEWTWNRMRRSDRKLLCRTTPKGFVGVYEFARRTRRDITSLYKIIYAGKLPGAHKSGRKWLLPESEVAAWTQEAEAVKGA